METFEIHITGSKGINEELDALGVKNIIVDLLTPERELFRTEYMSSFILKVENYATAGIETFALVRKLKTPIIRVKIETPYYEHYVDKSLYIESHFTPINNSLPVSRNVKSGKLMATDRCYYKESYCNFREKYKNAEVELCLFDTFVEEDKDWFDLYQK